MPSTGSRSTCATSTHSLTPTEVDENGGTCRGRGQGQIGEGGEHVKEVGQKHVASLEA